MTKIRKDLNLILLKLCEELLPKTKVAEEDMIKSAMKKVRQYLEGRGFQCIDTATNG